MATRGVPVRLVVWLFHLALPLLGLWLLLAVPSTDLLVEHHPAHFWLVALVAGVNVGLALVVDRAAQRHDDPRLLLVGLGFLVAALFFVLHALATPGVLLDTRNALGARDEAHIFRLGAPHRRPDAATSQEIAA